MQCQRPVIYVRRFPAAVVALVVLGAFAHLPAQAATEIWSRQGEFVRIERQDDGQAPQNEHPVRLAPAQLAAILAGLQVRHEGEAEPLPIFSSEEVSVLSAAVAEGLARAEPHEDIRFTTVGVHKLGAGGRVARRLLNSGRVFFIDGRLNLLFGEVHGEDRKRNVYGQRDQDLRTRRPASRSSPASVGWRLETMPGVTRRMQGGSERPDWLLISAETVSRAGAAQSTRHQLAPGKASLETSAGAGTARDRLARLRSLREEELIPDELYKLKVQEILAETAAPGAGVEDRLRTLKQLREEGLIAEQDYRSRLQEIVDEL
jgi:hypothetical protein